ncbi:MFS transporter [Kitasatospora sp. NPDC058170]|uniref:MFS transporter n=1 Tax=Kitasatospora sp. NPDC058170 TaxID=3346364 RepID=UPI0036DE5983
MASLKELIPPPGPIRVLCLSHVSKTAAHGILMSVAVLYFTRTVHIEADRVGLALSVGAVVGMLAAVPAGRLADSVGPRNTTVVLLCLMGVFVCGYPLVGDFTGLLAISALVLAVESSVDASVGALIAGLIPADERVTAVSYMRAAANLSVAIGAAAGAIGLYLDTHAAYLTLLFGAGALFVVAGIAYLSVPRVEPAPAEEAEGPIWPVLRDAPFAAVALTNSVLIMNSGVLIVALPIWISEHTDAPAWLFPLVVIINAASVVFFQVRVSKGTEDVPGGARAMRISGFLLAGCCALFALAGGRSPWLAVLVLVLGAMIHVIGEMLHAAGSWSLSFGLAPDHAQGQYQGMFAMSTQLGSMITPVLATVLLTRFGASGWLVFAVLFAVTGALVPSAARWAQRTRKPAAVAVAEGQGGIA